MSVELETLHPGVDGGPGRAVPAVVLALLLLPVVLVYEVPGGGGGHHWDDHTEDHQYHS